MTRSDGRPSRGPVSARIAVDLLGGDNAPAVVVDGALQAGTADPDLQLVLIGPQPIADEVIAALGRAAHTRVEVIAVTRGVGMADPVADGADPQTTIGAAVRAVASGRADGFVSAGASGAIVAASVMAIGRSPGTRRPALAAILPGSRGPVLLLDVGAGMQASVGDLIQHAVLGIGYADLVFDSLTEPRLGLLSVGAEPGKGDRLRRSADATLRQLTLPAGARYVGPVEGGDVVSGTRADVIVSDGFTGNILLKGIEAAIGVAAATYPSTEVPRAAALLGVARPVVICHGVATGSDIASGIALAARLVRTDAAASLAKLMEVSR